jgi:hypothetical protein
MRFQVLIVTSIKMTVFWNVVPVISQKLTDVSEVLMASIRALMMETVCTS